MDWDVFFKIVAIVVAEALAFFLGVLFAKFGWKAFPNTLFLYLFVLMLIIFALVFAFLPQGVYPVLVVLLLLLLIFEALTERLRFKQLWRDPLYLIPTLLAFVLPTLILIYSFFQMSKGISTQNAALLVALAIFAFNAIDIFKKNEKRGLSRVWQISSQLILVLAVVILLVS